MLCKCLIVTHVTVDHVPASACEYVFLCPPVKEVLVVMGVLVVSVEHSTAEFPTS